MNQILISEKVYVTPELKKKKKAYKFHFVLSILFVFALISFYLYTEYDKNKGVEASEQIFEEMNQTLAENKDKTTANEDILMVVLDGTEEDIEQVQQPQEDVQQLNKNAEIESSPNGYQYKRIATISIPKINVNLVVLQGVTGSKEETADLLKISPVKIHGYDPNEVGNFCIAGHNYRNTKFFSKVPTLVVGDTVKLTDLSGRTLTYSVYDKHNVDPKDVRDTTQLTGGKKELTLITCTDDNSKRVIVRCREVK